MVILPKHVLEASVDIDVPENIVGSGPFTQVGYQRGLYVCSQSALLEARPAFAVKVHIITDKGQALTAWLTEQVLSHSPVGRSGFSAKQGAALERDSRGKVLSTKLPIGPGGCL